MSLLRSPVKIECVSESTRVTACGGSALLLEMLIASRALADLPVDAGTPSRGWTDGQLILTVMLLKADEAPGRLVRESEPAVLGIARRRIKRRFRGGRERNFPSTRLLGQWLDRFHDTELHRTHPAGEAVARPDGPRHGLLREVNRRLVALGAGLAKAETATIDLDATIIGSGKRDCHYAYRAANRTVPGERGYRRLSPMSASSTWRPGWRCVTAMFQPPSRTGGVWRPRCGNCRSAFGGRRCAPTAPAIRRRFSASATTRRAVRPIRGASASSACSAAPHARKS